MSRATCIASDLVMSISGVDTVPPGEMCGCRFISEIGRGRVQKEGEGAGTMVVRGCDETRVMLIHI